MSPEEDRIVPPHELPEALKEVRERTPARLLAGRSGSAYRTNTQLELREAHAAARDAVRAEMNLSEDLGESFVRDWNVFEVCSRAATKDEYLLRPALGRQLNDPSRAVVLKCCAAEVDLQIVIGDGLSVTAIAAQVPQLLPLLAQGAKDRDWSMGAVFAVRHCRVGILNEIGELLRPKIAILLIGERPGLATAESLSAYIAHQPKPSDTDANRNLISNIHARGVSTEHAADRILNLIAAMIAANTSGCQLRETLPAFGWQHSQLDGQ